VTTADDHAARHAQGLPTALARVSFGVVRPKDARGVYAQPPAEFLRLTHGGVLHRLATGYYAIVPRDAHDRDWMPSLEAAGYGIGAANYGADLTVLMGLSAARLHGAIPRGLGVAVVAVPKQRPTLQLVDRFADIIFVRRDTARLDAERVTTDLGPALVTSIEQTVLDLARRPQLGGLPSEATGGVLALWPRCDLETLERLADEQRRRATLSRIRNLVGN
jgi:hypothetical protein